MATQQIELQRTQSGYDNEGLQQLQQELDEEHRHLQRMTSEEERADRLKMRRIFNSVSILISTNLCKLMKFGLNSLKFNSFIFVRAAGHRS